MTNKTEYSRRSIVKLGAQVPVVAAAAGLLTACGGEEVALCANPNSLSFSENSIRQASNYTESSPHADKNCLNCAFYTAEHSEGGGEVPNCGDCSIFEGLASKNGYCDSWSTKDTQQS